MNIQYALTACSAVICMATASAADLLVQYNPTGAQNSSIAVAPINVIPHLTAGNLSETGLIVDWLNTDVLPVGRISSSSTITLNRYVAFSVAAQPGYAMTFSNLLYDKVSYFGSGGTKASLRTNLNGFASDVATLTVSPSGIQSLDFSLSSLPPTTASVQFRLYFYAAPTDQTDWDDLLSTVRGYNGLRLQGAVIAVPEPSAGLLLVAGAFLLAGFNTLKRRRGGDSA